MRQYVSQFTAEQLGQFMGMSEGLAETFRWDLCSLSANDYQYYIDGSHGVNATTIVNADNVGGAQAAGEPISAEWEALLDNGGSGSHSVNWWHPDDSSWQSNGKSPQGIQLLSTTLNASSRSTVQTNSATTWDITGNQVACMCFILRDVSLNQTTAEMHIGLGRYTQSSTFSGGANVRNGAITMFLGGSSTTTGLAYDTSNSSEILQYNAGVANAGNPFDAKSHDNLGVFIWRTPDNASQSTTDWKWRGGTIWNDKTYFWSESQISGVAEDIYTEAGLSGGVDWGAFVTHRHQENNVYIAFQSAELWVGHF